METQSWNPESYARNARFVAELGMPVVELLDPGPGEEILDLGCGDGHLTLKLMAAGAKVIGVDSSAPQVEGARKAGVEAHVADARRLDYAERFDAVFSNATLHWIKEPDLAIDGVWKALKPGGRFVGEFGGHGCVARIREALGRALKRRGIDIAAVMPWYFPTPEDYGARLRARGFQVEHLVLFPRPTPLPGEMTGWLETFAESFTRVLPEADRAGFLKEAQEDARPDLCDAKGAWTADYTRLRFRAVKRAP